MECYIIFGWNFFYYEKKEYGRVSNFFFRVWFGNYGFEILFMVRFVIEVLKLKYIYN